MERNKKTPLLFLLLALFCAGAVGKHNCPSVPDNNLTCHTDYNSTITCVWNSTSVSDHPDNVCTIHAKMDSKYIKYKSSCTLKPVDVSRPTLKTCSLIFRRAGNFQTFHELSVDLSCNPGKQSLSIFYKPACHIKLNPPRPPHINFTTVSWLPQVTKHKRLSLYAFQLQWKQEDQSWSDPSVQGNSTVEHCRWNCTAELDPDLLIQDKRYEARIRVKAIAEDTESIWSDWSPTASWVSQIGRRKQPPSDLAGGVLAVVGSVAVLVMFLVVIHFKTDKTTWVYMVKRIRGPPLPNPANSFLQEVNFQTWLSPHFTSESFRSLFKSVEINSVEVTSSVDAVAPCGPEATLLEKIRSERSNELTSSNFSNPIYSELCPPPPPPPPPPPLSSLTAGNLAPCTTDTPYGPVGSQGNNAEQDRDEMRGKEIQQLLFKGSDSSEPMLVISDYEKAEKLQVQRVRLQSLDSGMCSGDEVSQDSLEADSINVTDEGHESNDQREGGDGKGPDFHKLFESDVCVFGKGSIQVCSGYEQVQKLQADSPELPSQDSGIYSGGEEQVSQEESLEDVEKSTESTRFLFPPLPPPSTTSPFSLASFAPLPLHFSGPGLSPALRPLSSHLLERFAAMSTTRSVESCGDGYMPVRQEQS